MYNKTKYKMIILTLLSLIILFIIGLVIYLVVNNRYAQNNIEESSSIYDKITIDALEFKIKDIKYDGLFSDITLEVKNNSNNNINLGHIKLIFKDKESNIISELLSTGSETVNSKDTIILETFVDIDLSLATVVEYELNGGNNYEE